MAIESQRLVLIAEAEQAFIARSLTVRLQVLAMLIEMTAGKSRSGDARNSISLLNQPTQILRLRPPSPHRAASPYVRRRRRVAR